MLALGTALAAFTDQYWFTIKLENPTEEGITDGNPTVRFVIVLPEAVVIVSGIYVPLIPNGNIAGMVGPTLVLVSVPPPEASI